MPESQDLVDPGLERRARLPGCVDLVAHARRRRLRFARVERAEQLVLGLEVTVERASREVRLTQDLSHIGVNVAIAFHHSERRVEQDAQLVLGFEAPGSSRARE